MGAGKVVSGIETMRAYYGCSTWNVYKVCQWARFCRLGRGKYLCGAWEWKPVPTNVTEMQTRINKTLFATCRRTLHDNHSTTERGRCSASWNSATSATQDLCTSALPSNFCAAVTSSPSSNSLGPQITHRWQILPRHETILYRVATLVCP